MKVRILIIAFYLLGHFENCSSQVQEDWFRTYYGASPENLSNDFVIDTYGNSYIVGYSGEFISAFTSVKYNSNGELQWVDQFHGTSMGLDVARAVAADNMGNVYVAGECSDIGELESYYVIKYNSSGDKIWIRKFKDTTSSRDFARDICLDKEGNVYVTGHSYFYGSYDRYMNTIKYDSSGNVIWKTRFSDSLTNYKYASSISVDNSHNVYVTGYSSYYFFTVKYNSDGIQQWVSFFDNLQSMDISCDLEISMDNNVYVLGKCFVGTNYEFYTCLIKYNHNNGSEIWSFKTDSIGREQNYYGGTQSFKIDSFGNSYVATTYKGNFSILKIDSGGTQLWNLKYSGRPLYMDATGRAVDMDNEGFIYATGSSTKPLGSHDFCTLKCNSQGDLIWLKTFHSDIPSDDDAAFINVNSSGQVYVGGMAYSTNDSHSKFCVVKYSQTVGIQNVNSNAPSDCVLYQNYPNPFNPKTTITYYIPLSDFIILKIYDILGNEIQTLENQKKTAGTYKIEFDGTNFASGIYYFKLISKNFNRTKRMVLLK